MSQKEVRNPIKMTATRKSEVIIKFLLYLLGLGFKNTVIAEVTLWSFFIFKCTTMCNIYVYEISFNSTSHPLTFPDNSLL